ncbi:hypothetical protein RBA41_04085 [Massilia sp. CCM 9210]|nr:hydroxyisourate hydrolase [Massilia sp. CCM 9210]MDQ1812476.1 hypothetical protein [Massilia sp. CCM 9210]
MPKLSVHSLREGYCHEIEVDRSRTGLVGLAAVNPLSVHALHLRDGLPSAQVEVTSGQQWIALDNGLSNADGRMPALLPEGERFDKGIYRVTF